jgi:hypothetical protein
VFVRATLESLQPTNSAMEHETTRAKQNNDEALRGRLVRKNTPKTANGMVTRLARNEVLDPLLKCVEREAELIVPIVSCTSPLPSWSRTSGLSENTQAAPTGSPRQDKVKDPFGGPPEK